MLNRLVQSAQPLATQAAELAAAVPQVMAYRLSRMAFAGAIPSLRDRKEFELMSAEKTDAFMESWSAMALQTAQFSQDLALSVLSSFWAPWSLRWTSPDAAALQFSGAALAIAQKGIEPLHRRAVANAERLGRIGH